MTADIVSLKTDIHETMQSLGQSARKAYGVLTESSSEKRNAALKYAADAMRAHQKIILTANEKDLKAGKENDLPDAMLDRLALTPARIEAIASGLEDIAALPDPIGKTLSSWTRPNGLKIERVSVPLGVIGIIYESRPNVTADAGSLCLKSGNAAILRGGSESFYSSKAIVDCLHEGLKKAGLPESAIQLVPTTDRAAVGEMLTMVGLIDIIVPRGGRALTERVLTDSRIPTILHLDGNCHTYIHKDADLAMATKVLLNAKLRRTGICGATESLLIDESIAARALPSLTDALHDAGCEMRGDATAQEYSAYITPANDSDWETEYLDAILSIKVVSGLEEAITHINHFGSHHTDAIITRDEQAAQTFLKRIDSAIVMHNASTQFADGGEFGMGAEIGISTGRLHARGPVGAEQLTTYKYIVHGTGQIRPK